MTKDDTTGLQTAVTTVTKAKETLDLGRNLLDPDGIVDNATTGQKGQTGAQDLYVAMTVEYRLAGFNISTGNMKWYSTTTALAYQNRELPSVDQGVTAAAPSGLEKVIRECNGNATKNDTFAIISRDYSATTAIPGTMTLAATQCDGLKADTTKDKWSLAAFNATLASPAYDCVTAFTPLATAIQQGNWSVSGTSLVHTDRISNAAPAGAGDLKDMTTTDITPVQL